MEFIIVKVENGYMVEDSEFKTWIFETFGLAMGFIEKQFGEDKKHDPPIGIVNKNQGY